MTKVVSFDSGRGFISYEYTFSFGTHRCQNYTSSQHCKMTEARPYRGIKSGSDYNPPWKSKTHMEKELLIR